jgi:FkbM family methyltransferase
MGIARVLKSAGSLSSAAVLSGVYAYGWLQMRSGRALAGHTGQGRSTRSAIASSGLAKRYMSFRMRDGSRMLARVVDSGGLLSVHADRDYDVPGINWRDVRTIVDIGAHIGSFTVWAARRAPDARCLAVEPNPATFRLLGENVRANGLGERVILVNAAVAGKAGTGSLELVEHSLGTRLARNDGGEVSVDVVTLDAVANVAGMERIDVLKIDCEGMEYELFGSIGPERLAGIGVIACEYHPVPGHDISELDGVLTASGFEVRHPNKPLGVLWATRPPHSTV